MLVDSAPNYVAEAFYKEILAKTGQYLSITKTLIFAEAEDVFRLLGQKLDGLLDDPLKSIILHLDDIFAGNH